MEALLKRSLRIAGRSRRAKQLEPLSRASEWFERDAVLTTVFPIAGGRATEAKPTQVFTVENKDTVRAPSLCARAPRAGWCEGRGGSY